MLSSSLVSSITIDNALLASSEGDGEGEGGGGGGNEENGSGEQGGGGGDEQQGDESSQEGIEGEDQQTEDQSAGDLSQGEQALVGDQPVSCSDDEVLNPGTGECEEAQLEEIGDEICNNSKDDDLDGEVDESDCEQAEDQSAAATNPTSGIPSFDPLLSSPPDSTIPSFSPLTDSESENTPEDQAVSDESLADMGMGMGMDSSMPALPPSPTSLPTTPPPTTATPGDAAPTTLPADPDFCSKEAAQQKLTGGTPSPQCLQGQGQNSGTPSPLLGDPFLDTCKQPMPLSDSDIDKILGFNKNKCPAPSAPEPQTAIPPSSNNEPTSEPSTGQPSDNQPLPEPQTAPISQPSDQAAPSSFLGVGTFSKQSDGTRTITNVKTLDKVNINTDESIIFNDAKGEPFGAVTSEGVVTFRTASGNVYVVGAGARAGDFSIGHVDDKGETQSLQLDSPGVIESRTGVRDASTGETVEKESGQAIFKDAAGKSFGAVVTTPDGTFVGWTQPENGNIYLVAPDRTVAILTPEGGSFTVGPDNISTEQSPTGYILTYYPNGSYSREDPETRITTTYDPAGNVIGKVMKDEFGNIKATPVIDE